MRYKVKSVTPFDQKMLANRFKSTLQTELALDLVLREPPFLMMSMMALMMSLMMMMMADAEQHAAAAKAAEEMSPVVYLGHIPYG